ncbi:MAG: hypothetical protein K8R54_12145 [Bacteroidales bacterium]|nr:hypothetical protein [Bacteroidales bacterium]
MRKTILTISIIIVTVFTVLGQITLEKIFETELLQGKEVGHVRKMAISPNGKYLGIILVSGKTRKRQLYKINNEKLVKIELETVNGGMWKDDVGCITFSRDSKHLIFINSLYNSFYIWNVNTGKQVEYIFNDYYKEYDNVSIFSEFLIYDSISNKFIADDEYLYRDNRFYHLSGKIGEKVLRNSESYKWEGAKLLASACFFYNNGKNALMTQDPGKLVRNVDCSTGQIINTTPKLNTIYDISINKRNIAILRCNGRKSYIYNIDSNVIEAEIFAEKNKGCYGMSVSENYFAYTSIKNIVIGKLKKPETIFEFEHSFKHGNSKTIFTKDEKHLIVGMFGYLEMYRIETIN